MYIYIYIHTYVNMCVVKGDCLQRGAAAQYGLHAYIRGSLPIYRYIYIHMCKCVCGKGRLPAEGSCSSIWSTHIR